MIVFAVVGIILEIILIVTYEKYLSQDWNVPGTRWNYLAFFTQITNIIVDSWLILVGVSILTKHKKLYKLLTRVQVQGAITLYIVVVGLIYCGILFWFTKLYPPVHWWGNLINAWHHIVVPLTMMILYIKMPHNGHVNWRNLAYWMIYPIAYLVLSEIRGIIDGWYAYPFLDPGTGVIFPLSLLGIVAVITGLGWIMIYTHNLKCKGSCGKCRKCKKSGKLVTRS